MFCMNLQWHKSLKLKKKSFLGNTLDKWGRNEVFQVKNLHGFFVSICMKIQRRKGLKLNKIIFVKNLALGF